MSKCGALILPDLLVYGGDRRTKIPSKISKIWIMFLFIPMREVALLIKRQWWLWIFKQRKTKEAHLLLLGKLKEEMA